MNRDDSEHNDASHDELIQDYLENEATPVEEEQFRRLLDDKSFRRRVADYAIDLGHLYDQARQGVLVSALPAQRSSVSRARRRVFAVAAAASILLAVTATWWAFRDRDSQPEVAGPNVSENQAAPPAVSAPDPPPAGTSRPLPPPTAVRTQGPVVARVGSVTGTVLMGADVASKQRRKIGNKAELRSGNVLQTVGSDSFAVLKFNDGSNIVVFGETELTCAVVDLQKRLAVRRGDIMAQVSHQRGNPMIIKTPVAEAEVVGTRLSIFADLALTELAVQEGHVRLTRFSDDQTIDVKQGQCAVASKTSRFIAEPIDPVPDVWEEDFEDEWPERWRAGHRIQSGLPPGSLGAALAVSGTKDGGPCFISTPNEWSRGLFVIEDDTYLNLTYKLKWPQWFYIMLETRSEDYTGDYRGHFMFQTPGIWKIPRDEWRTVSIPISDFHEPQRGRPDGTALPPPTVSDVVFSLFLRTSDENPGLLVDRIWVTRGAAETDHILRMGD